MLLLDSQALLWVLQDSARLGPTARNAIRSAAAVHYSAASIWELTIKQLLGRLELPADFEDGVTASGLIELAVTSQHARALTRFPSLVRHDPFDRLLIAQAAVDHLTLITADRVLLALPDAPVADASA